MQQEGQSPSVAFKQSEQSLSDSREGAIENLAFRDLDEFDQEFSTLLDSEKSKNVEVSFVAPVTINEFPPRLQKWLSVVKDSDGNVTVTPRTRGIGLSVLLMAPQAYSYIKELMLYKPAKKYNAVISHNPSTGMVEKFSFVKKENN